MRPQLFFRAVGIALALMTGIAADPPPVWGHAVIIDAKPAVGAIIPPGDVQVVLHYNSRIDHARSRLTLVGPDQKPRPIAIDADSAPDQVTAKIADLPAGDYRLRWQVLAIDGHLTRGDIPFSVKSEQTN